MLVTGTSTNFCPGADWAETEAAGAEVATEGVAAGAEAPSCSMSLAVIDPSNPEPRRETEAKLMPLSAASMRAMGEAKIRSDPLALLGAAGAIQSAKVRMT